jgi:hypothetical protein
MPLIDVTVCGPGPALEPHWHDLVGRASPNVFMAPAALAAADGLGVSDIQVLLAWEHDGAGKRLVGWWALQQRSMEPGWPKFLMGPPFSYAFLSDPVVEKGFASVVIPAFYDAIARAPHLPKLIRLQHLDAYSEAGAAILDACKNSYSTLVTERRRPFASQEANLKKSGSTRKKLRQDWNKLSALGRVDVVNERSAVPAQSAFETFLTLEAASWKGAKGTAFLSRAADAGFARRLAANMAAGQALSVALLQLDGRAIAAQVLLYSGNMAYTWKTAYDQDFAKYSPGALLVEKVTGEVLATPGITAIESCSLESGFMGQLWEGRRTSVDLLVHVGRQRSLGLDILAGRERAYKTAKKARDQVRVAAQSVRAIVLAAFAGVT